MADATSAGKNGHGQAHGAPHGTRAMLLGAVGAIGVVYGDIGTSPLYALKECFAGEGHVTVTNGNVLGVLSLFFWSLTAVIVVKYLSFMLIADNQGEGGILALLALLVPRTAEERTRAKMILVFIGLFGAALLYGDGMITPAISVLSAVEGLEVATPDSPGLLKPYVVPITIGILLGLFLVQKRGTHAIGGIFGPATLLWFAAISAAGVPWILRHPQVLWAVDPRHAIDFFVRWKLQGFLLLGSVVLCVTGGEALYADMGHFGKRPIRVAWYSVVFPSLLANYFGQGAYLLDRGARGASTSFYGLVTEWPKLLGAHAHHYEWLRPYTLYPMVVVATVATVVASQALISGAFSLSSQAVQLGFSPRVTVEHTSAGAEGQIYVPEVNSLLMIACIALVVGFGSSTRLAGAYGIAVTGTMSITSVLFFAVMRQRWGTLRAGLLLAVFLTFDLAFLAANAVKIEHGGWFPLVIGLVVYTVMTTWKRGRAALYDVIKSRTKPMDDLLEELERDPPNRIPGAAVFMTSNPTGAPPVLTHHLKHNRSLHELVLLLSIQTDRTPEVRGEKRVELKKLGHGLYHVTAHYGFMQSPKVADILRHIRSDHGIIAEIPTTTFYLGRETLLPDGTSHMMKWRKVLFAFLSRNARPATTFFNIPPDRVVEIGMQIPL